MKKHLQKSKKSKYKSKVTSVKNPSRIIIVFFTLIGISVWLIYQSMAVTPSINLADGLDAEEAAFLKKSVNKDKTNTMGTVPAPVVKVTVKDKDTGEEYTGKVILSTIDQPNSVSVADIASNITSTVINNNKGIAPSPPSKDIANPPQETNENTCDANSSIGENSDAARQKCTDGKKDQPSPSPTTNNSLETVENNYLANSIKIDEVHITPTIVPTPTSNPSQRSKTSTVTSSSPELTPNKDKNTLNPTNKIQSPRPSPQPITENSSSTLHAGEQCDDKWWTPSIPNCNECKDSQKIENTLSNGKIITSCLRGEPMVDQIVTSRDMAVAEPIIFNKGKNDGKLCDSGDRKSDIYCGNVCENDLFSYVTGVPRCGMRDIVTEIKNCDGQAFHTWNTDINDCLFANPDTNYIFNPIDHPVSPDPAISSGLIIIGGTDTEATIPTTTNMSTTSIEKASALNIFNKQKNTNKSCDPQSLIASCHNLCANGMTTMVDEYNQIITDENGFTVIFCQ